jgi:DNA-directed RNA polymerase specialized sigma24 family protein
MPQPTDGSLTAFFVRFRAGDDRAASALCERFFPRLVGLARQALAGKTIPVSDADDAAQSALASFWQRAKRGDFGDRLDRDDLWRLLALFTLRKTRRHLRHERAQRRGGGQIVSGLELDNYPGDLASAGEIDLACEELLGLLDEGVRPFAVLRLFGYRNREIAEQLDCTERKVERKLQIVRLAWERLLAN